jgi:hypothetical protein
VIADGPVSEVWPYEVREDFNIFMYGHFVWVTDAHPADCACGSCRPQPEKPQPQPYDSLYLKQKKSRDYWSR